MSFSASLDHLIEQNRNGLLSKDSSWERVELRSIAKILNGFPFPSEKFSRDSGTPLLRIRDILAQTTETKYEGAFDPLYLVKSGDFLIGMDGDFNSALWNGTEALLNQRVCKLKVNESFYSKKLLSYALPGYLKAINDATSSITVKHLSSRTIEEIPLPLPPRLEQDRIVSEIEKQFTRLADAVAALKRVQANLKRYRASVLKAACEGRLVPTEAELAHKEGRSYEPASELLKRILAERRTSWQASQLQKMIAAGKPPKNDEWKKKYQEPDAPDISQLPELPVGWIWAAWGQIGVSQNGRPFPSKAYSSEGVKLLRPGNLHSSGRLEWTEQNTRRLPGQFESENTDLIVGPNELVINLTAQSLKDEFLGRVCLSPREEHCLLNQRLARLTPMLMSRRYCLWMFKSHIFRRFVDELNTGSLIQHMFTSQLAEFQVPVPPLAEQERIADAIEEKLSSIEVLELACQKAVVHASGLRTSVLGSAFSGKLVPQDPRDEPASVLLERIRAARAALATNNGNQEAPSQAGTTNGQRRRRITRLAHRVSGGKCVKK